MQILAPILVAAAPVVDIDGTAYLQLGIFLLLMLILHPLLFKPWLETRERREQAIAGAVAEAERLTGNASSLGDEYDKKLARVRDEAQGIRNDARKESEATRSRIVTDARASAGRELEVARETAAREAQEAREALQGEIEGLAAEVAGKLLGRAI
ncbi:MAG: ATP synthase F0 subunit B [Myxococcales bacterium]|nr:ATP synthase F0 subunit B [Myxococcales bacterium]